MREKATMALIVVLGVIVLIVVWMAVSASRRR